MSEVRPHYKQAWPPWVHAIALWLNSVAFEDENNTMIGACDENPVTVTIDSPMKTPRSINADRFYLISGICVEALSSPLSSYPAGTVETCVCAMDALLESPFGRSCIVKEKQLTIELLTVLHRLLLTNEEGKLQHTILNIVLKCTQGMHEQILLEEEGEGEGSINKGVNVQGCRESVIASKKSVVFSVLEICCYVVKKYCSDVIPEGTHNTPVTTTSATTAAGNNLSSCQC